MPPASLAVLVTARNEAADIAETVTALREAFPGARLLVADDASDDETAAVARQAGAEVRGVGRRRGKGAAATVGVEALLSASPPPATLLLCDGDLGASAGRLPALVEHVEDGRCDLAVAVFARRTGGGVGLVVAAGRVAVRSLAGRSVRAPLSGQRALRADAAAAVLPLARGFGMEVGMTVDALRAGHRLCEVELDLSHRATGRTPRGFAHRARQLRDVLGAWRARRGARAPVRAAAAGQGGRVTSRTFRE